MTISPEAASALLALCQSVTIEETADRVWIVVRGEKIVGLEAGSAKADKLMQIEELRQAAVTAATT